MTRTSFRNEAIVILCVGGSLAGFACGGGGEVKGRSPTSAETYIPWQAPQGDPFADAVFAEGMDAWRRPHPHGACANCHTPDGIDLARLNYTDSVVIRRAVAQEATEEDAKKIVAMLHYLRDRYKIDKPLDPVIYRPFQPGGELLPGATYEERDAALYDELREMGHPLAQEELISSVEEAEAAVAKILEIDLRKVKIGIPFARWTEDGFRGQSHLSVNDWIPDIPRAPKAGKEAEWYKLQNDYISAPTEENFWRYMDAAVALTDDLGLLQAPEGDTFRRLMLQKYLGVQNAGHMFRYETSNRPSPFNLAFAATPQDPNDPAVKVIRSRMGSFWDIGSDMKELPGSMYQDNNWQDLPDFVLAKVRENRDFDGLADLERISWFYAGFQYDPGLQFTASANREEYFLESFGKIAQFQDLAVHFSFVASTVWISDIFGRDLRLSTFYGTNGPSGNMTYTPDNKCSLGFYGTTRAPFEPEAAESTLRPGKPNYDGFLRFSANVTRLNFYGRLKHLRENGTISDLDRWSQCADGLKAELARFEGPLGLPGIPEADLAEFESLVAAASLSEVKLTELPEGYVSAPHFKRSFGNEVANNPLPLMFPLEAANGGGQPEITAVYADTCAGCHATFGEGQGIYPAIPGPDSDSLDRFRALVREGREGEGMPAFGPDLISDQDLEAIYNGLLSAKGN